MKMHSVLLLGATTILFTQIASAELPINKKMLAQIDATVDFCSQAKPDSSQKFKDINSLLSQRSSANDLDQARSSDEYKQARKAVSESLGKMNKDEVEKTCGLPTVSQGSNEKK